MDDLDNNNNVNVLSKKQFEPLNGDKVIIDSIEESNSNKGSEAHSNNKKK